MTSGAFWAFGSILQLGDGATPEVFTSIAEIQKLVPPKMKRASANVTTHGSTGGWEEFIPVLRDGGEVGVEANWLPNNATQDETTGIWKSFTDNTNHNWRIVLPDSIATLAFAGHVNSLEPDLPKELQGKLAFGMKVSGPVTVS